MYIQYVLADDVCMHDGRSGVAHLNLHESHHQRQPHSSIGPLWNDDRNWEMQKKKQTKNGENKGNDDDKRSQRKNAEQFRKVIKKDLVETVNCSNISGTWAVSSFVVIICRFQKWMKLCAKLLVHVWAVRFVEFETHGTRYSGRSLQNAKYSPKSNPPDSMEWHRTKGEQTYNLILVLMCFQMTQDVRLQTPSVFRIKLHRSPVSDFFWKTFPPCLVQSLAELQGLEYWKKKWKIDFYFSLFRTLFVQIVMADIVYLITISNSQPNNNRFIFPFFFSAIVWT